MRTKRHHKIGFAVLVGALAFAVVLSPLPAGAEDDADGLVIAKPEPTRRAQPPVRQVAPEPSQAQAAAHPAADARAAARASGPYFIEFRSRYAQSYGHTFLVHGRVGQKITRADVAGLHPAGEEPGNWVVGHFIWVPSETGASDGDTEEKYVSARYRVTMNKAQYDRVLAYIRKVQADSPMWNASLYNCNAFVGKIAEFMGLKVPSSSLLYPKVYITTLRLINTGHPEAGEKVWEANSKEMNSPTRDGQAMRAAGAYRTETPPARKPSSARVSIGSVRPANAAPQQ